MVYYGYKAQEVAKILNIPVEEVKIGIRKAMKRKAKLN
jgi:DNA-directed RNA polymerase specialized sigma24 family protein